MDNEDLGHPSKSKNSEVSDNERPLKKARYLWQVKGKYHLKENAKPNTDEESSNERNNTKEMKEDKNNLYSDRSCIEAFIRSSDKIMEYPESPPLDNSDKDEIPVSLVKPNHINEDFFLRKWQARQIAKGFVDNTINRVLEGWMVAPFDANDLIENCENGGQVEDEGILMAIQSHGLQSCTCPSNIQSSKQPSNPLKPFHQRTNSNLIPEYYENLCILNDTEPVTSNFFVQSTYAENHLSSDDDDDDDEIMAAGTPDVTDYDDLKTDFLDAAVAVAIQKKGLLSYNCG